jgi:hypothetical protein
MQLSFVVVSTNSAANVDSSGLLSGGKDASICWFVDDVVVFDANSV